MNVKQQELYEKLLKKVNEYCLGATAEDVIAAIDALVETYEKPKKRISKTKDQLLVENEAYQLMLHTVRYYVESKEYSLEDLVKRLKALRIIKEHRLDIDWFLQFVKQDISYKHYVYCVDHSVNEFAKRFLLSKEEYKVLKEVLK